MFSINNPITILRNPVVTALGKVRSIRSITFLFCFFHFQRKLYETARNLEGKHASPPLLFDGVIQGDPTGPTVELVKPT